MKRIAPWFSVPVFASFTSRYRLGRRARRQLVHRTRGLCALARRCPRRPMTMPAYALAFGRTLNPNWDLELGVLRFPTRSCRRRKPGAAGSRRHRQARVLSRRPGESLLEFRPRPRQQHHSAMGANDDDLAALYGVGLLIDLGGSRDDGTAMQLRADLGARRGTLRADSDISHPVDYIAGLGIQYTWGGSPARKVVDTDGDGVTDDLDKCPGTPAGTAVDSNGCPLRRRRRWRHQRPRQVSRHTRRHQGRR